MSLLLWTPVVSLYYCGRRLSVSTIVDTCCQSLLLLTPVVCHPLDPLVEEGGDVGLLAAQVEDLVLGFQEGSQ